MMIRSALIFALLVSGAAVAQQRDSRSREEQLEEMVRELAQEVRELKQRLDSVEGTAAPPVTERRIQHLEQTVEEIKKEQPTAEERELFRKWTSESMTLRPFWNNGLNFESNDGTVKMKIGGRVHLDTAFFAENGTLERRFGDFEDGVTFRRARINFEGSIRENIDFKTQYDFAGGSPNFRDVYLGFRKLPYVGNLRIGQFKEPFSLEQLTSSNYITFMERSLADTFAPSRNVGFMFHDTFLDQRMTGAIGAFRPTDNFGTGTGDHQYSVTGRVTALPWYEDGGKKLLHVGAAYSYQNYEDPIRFRARPESGLAPRIVDTGNLRANHGHLTGLEAALVHGPFSLQSELIHICINGKDAFVGDPEFWGGYVQASYFLTGEHRPYSRSSGTFGRVKPNRNFREDGGWGAWEVAGRFSHLDLNDGNIRGGRLRDFTLGLNWYLNPSVRAMWNYVYSDAAQGGDVSIYQARLQIAF